MHHSSPLWYIHIYIGPWINWINHSSASSYHIISYIYISQASAPVTGGGHLQELRCRLRHQRGRRSVAGEAAGGDQHEAQLLGIHGVLPEKWGKTWRKTWENIGKHGGIHGKTWGRTWGKTWRKRTDHNLVTWYLRLMKYKSPCRHKNWGYELAGRILRGHLFRGSRGSWAEGYRQESTKLLRVHQKWWFHDQKLAVNHWNIYLYIYIPSKNCMAESFRILGIF